MKIKKKKLEILIERFLLSEQDLVMGDLDFDLYSDLGSGKIDAKTEEKIKKTLESNPPEIIKSKNKTLQDIETNTRSNSFILTITKRYYYVSSAFCCRPSSMFMSDVSGM